jgi:hypothetical protein
MTIPVVTGVQKARPFETAEQEIHASAAEATVPFAQAVPVDVESSPTAIYHPIAGSTRPPPTTSIAQPIEGSIRPPSATVQTTTAYSGGHPPGTPIGQPRRRNTGRLICGSLAITIAICFCLCIVLPIIIVAIAVWNQIGVLEITFDDDR